MQKIQNQICSQVLDQANNGENHDVHLTNAVETRASVKRKAKGTSPLKVASPISEVSATDVQKEQHSDDSLEKLWKKSKEKPDLDSKFVFLEKDGFLMRECLQERPFQGKRLQLVVPKAYRESVLKIAHDGLMSGHQGTARTTEKIMTQFYWPNMTDDIKHYCRSCETCQRTIQKGKVGEVPLGKMPRIDVPFRRVAVDLAGPITPVSDRGKRYILVVVDVATRYPEAVALADITTETVADALVEIFSSVGVPEEMLSDHGTQFTSDVMKEVSRLLSLKPITSTVYHAMSNGLAEKNVGIIKQMLKRMCIERPKDWDRYLKPLLFAYRECPHASLGGFSPFKVLNG